MEAIYGLLGLCIPLLHWTGSSPRFLFFPLKFRPKLGFGRKRSYDTTTYFRWSKTSDRVVGRSTVFGPEKVEGMYFGSQGERSQSSHTTTHPRRKQSKNVTRNRSPRQTRLYTSNRSPRDNFTSRQKGEFTLVRDLSFTPSQCQVTCNWMRSTRIPNSHPTVQTKL